MGGVERCSHVIRGHTHTGSPSMQSACGVVPGSQDVNW